MAFLEIAQAITKPLTKEDFTKFQEKLVTQIIFIFDKGYLKEINMTVSFEMLLTIKVVYMSNVVAKFA